MYLGTHPNRDQVITTTILEYFMHADKIRHLGLDSVDDDAGIQI